MKSDFTNAVGEALRRGVPSPPACAPTASLGSLGAPSDEQCGPRAPTSDSFELPLTDFDDPNLFVRDGATIIMGATVRLHSLIKATHLNDRIGVVVGQDDDRWHVQVDPRSEAVRIRGCNLQAPAWCPGCGGEITSSKCYACDFYFQERFLSTTRTSDASASVCPRLSEEEELALFGDSEFDDCTAHYLSTSRTSDASASVSPSMT